ncbi:MAG: hypothetical protein AAGI38_00105 [Bacteroidota bacterium]
MRISAFGLVVGMVIQFQSGFSQTAVSNDTMPTGPSISHVFLNIQVPTGDLNMWSSRMCGYSISEFRTSDPNLRLGLSSNINQYGHLTRNFSVDIENQLTAKAISPAEAVDDFGSKVISLQGYEEESFATLFLPDPSATTDLYLDLGRGITRLNLSDMSFNRVEIHSAFSDIHITYDAPNRVEMEKMDIHVAKAKVVLKNLEFAQAEMISVRNDMGETKATLGKGKPVNSTVFIQQGMGDCILRIHPDHPTKIVLKSGLFTDANLPDDFQELEAGQAIYVNQAYIKRAAGAPCTHVICNIDFGTLTVISQR